MRYTPFMAGKQDPSLVVLREIRKELQGTNARLDQTNVHLEALDHRVDQTNVHLEALDHRVDQTNVRLDQTNARLETLDNRVDFLGRRQTEAELRLATEVIAVAKAMGEVKDLLVERLDERGRLEDHERRITALEAKSG